MSDTVNLVENGPNTKLRITQTYSICMGQLRKHADPFVCSVRSNIIRIGALNTKYTKIAKQKLQNLPFALGDRMGKCKPMEIYPINLDGTHGFLSSTLTMFYLNKCFKTLAHFRSVLLSLYLSVASVAVNSINSQTLKLKMESHWVLTAPYSLVEYKNNSFGATNLQAIQVKSTRYVDSIRSPLEWFFVLFCFVFLQKQMENKQNRHVNRKFLDTQKNVCFTCLWSSNIINHINRIQNRIFMILYQVLGYIYQNRANFFYVGYFLLDVSFLNTNSKWPFRRLLLWSDLNHLLGIKNQPNTLYWNSDLASIWCGI